MRVRRKALVFLPALLILGCWELVARIHPQLKFFVGSPSSIYGEAKMLIAEGGIGTDLLVTTSEELVGFIVGSVVGTAIGLSLWYSGTVYEMTKPYIVALGSIPVFALGPMLIFWFGVGFLSKAVLAFLSTVVIAIVQAYTGASEVDLNLVQLLRVFKANRSQIFTKLIAPSAMIWVVAGVRINIGMALLGAFIGEFIASSRGLGHLIVVAEGLFNVAQIWVGVFGILLIALCFQAIMAPLEGWARRWQATSR